MAVVATAGHVDHGKSTLVRALTGIEPDRWSQERARGLTIDLGFAWTTLPSGREVSFVDVPGHQRFVGNLLAGLGPSPAVCFVVAVDEGWQAQSADHRDAIAALGINTGVVVLTRMDRAPQRVAEVRAQVRTELARTGLAQAPMVPVSAVEGDGLGDLAHTLDQVLAQMPAPEVTAPVRLWVDRAFAVDGAGTVVTGTLAQGSLARGDSLDVFSRGTSTTTAVRGLQTHQERVERVTPATRVAVNLRGVAKEAVGRGDVLLSPGAWLVTDSIDVRRRAGAAFPDMPAEFTVHVGTASVPARCRPFDADHARLRLAAPLPLRVGDQAVLRGSGTPVVLGGVVVLDVDPPALVRRGAGGVRADVLARMGRGRPAADLLIELDRRAAVTVQALARLGLPIPDQLPRGVQRHEEWLVDARALHRWAEHLAEHVSGHLAADALSQGVSDGSAIDLLGLPDPALLPLVVRSAGLVQRGGRITRAAAPRDLGAAEQGVAELQRRLRAEPFVAPTADALAQWGLGAKELAAAERQHRVLRLDDDIVLLPDAPARAMRVLASLEQPFTTSAARQALGTTRRTAVPLLEHLDARGWTRRVDGTQRVVVR